MSDLAPFVAAAIRDKVVDELRAENEKLRRDNEILTTLLHERHPVRSVQLRSNDGESVVNDSTLHVDLIYEDFWDRRFTFLNRRGGSTNLNTDTIVGETLSYLLDLEVWVDGARAIALKDLTIHYNFYEYTEIEEGWEYIVEMKLRDDEGNIELDFDILGATPGIHQELLRLESAVDHTPHSDPEEERPAMLHHEYLGSLPEVDLTHLLDVCGDMTVFCDFNRLSAKGSWLASKFTPQYVREPDENGSRFSEYLSTHLESE